MAVYALHWSEAAHKPRGYTCGPWRKVEHSGYAFHSQVHARGCMVWPIEELFVRHAFKRTVRERIARLNAHGKEEGAGCQGWHSKFNPRWFLLMNDYATLSEFHRKWGRDAVPERIIKRGRHKFVTRLSLVAGPNGG